MIPLTQSSTDQIVSYITEIVGDFLPLIVIVLGIGVGIWVINKILHRD